LSFFLKSRGSPSNHRSLSLNLQFKVVDFHTYIGISIKWPWHLHWNLHPII